jgi:hypothetical protein
MYIAVYYLPVKISVKNSSMRPMFELDACGVMGGCKPTQVGRENQWALKGLLPGYQ